MLLTAQTDNALQVALVLIVTVGVFVLAWLVSRALAKRAGRIRHGGAIQKVDRMVLGKDRQIVLLKIGEEHYMAGITPHHISFSAPVDPGDAFTAAETARPDAAANGPRPWLDCFADQLKRRTGFMGNPKRGDTNDEE